MQRSRQIAGLVGPSLVMFTLSETVNLHALADTSAAVIYLNGAMIFVAGLAILRTHNFWTYGWPVLVTLVGWMLLLGGLVRMFVPALQQDLPDEAKLTNIAVVFVVGAILTIKGYIPKSAETDT